MNKPHAARKYQAFISYNHAADGKLAPAVQRALQRFGRAWFSPASIQVFRDETGLGLTPDLWGEIQQRLEQSQCFLLLASPEAAQSQWVEQEVRFWLEHRPDDPLLIVLTAGKISWNKGDFDWNQTTALPRALAGACKQEPLWADLSWAKADADLSLRNPRFFVEIAKLVAGMRQAPLEQVYDEAAVQQRKAIRLLRATVAALSVLTVLAIAAATISFRPVVEARRTRAHAEQMQRLAKEQADKEAASAQLAAKAAAVLDEDRELSMLLALRAMDIAPTRQAEHALRQTLLELTPPLVLEGHRGAVFAAQFSADGRRVLTSGEDGTVCLWNAATGTNILKLQVITDLRSNCRVSGSLSKDGSRILTVAGPDTLETGYWKSSTEPKLYDAFTGALLTSLSDQYVVNAQVSPDNALIATVGFDTAVRIWDARTGIAKIELAGHEQRVASGSFSSNGKWLVTASWDGTARIWETGANRCLAILKMPKGNGADFAAFGPDDSRVITLCNGRKEIHVWDWSKRPGDPIATLAAEGGSIRDFAFSPDGQWLATGSFDKTARIWDTMTGKCLQILSGHSESVDGVDVSPNGRWVVTASEDKTAQIWDAATGENLMQLGWNNSPRTCVAFSPDGKRIVTGTADGAVPIYTYDVLSSGQELRRLAEPRRREFTPAERKKYLGDAPR